MAVLRMDGIRGLYSGDILAHVEVLIGLTGIDAALDLSIPPRRPKKDKAFISADASSTAMTQNILI